MNTRTSYSTILWDIDGTLTDPKEGITKCVQYALERLGFPVPPADTLHWVIGPSLMYSFAQLLETDDPELIQTAIALYRERFSPIGLFENQVYPGIPELLSDLAQLGVKNILATSKPHVFAKRILEKFELDSFFFAVAGAELDGRNQDKKDVISVAMSCLPDAETERIVMVGDRKHDVIGARHHGLDVISVLYGYGSREELEEAAPTRLVGTVDELRGVLIS